MPFHRRKRLDAPSGFGGFDAHSLVADIEVRDFDLSFFRLSGLVRDPSPVDLFDVYVALWRRAQEAGACVHYFDHPRGDPPSLRSDHTGASGWFLANADVEGAQPIIQVYRLECDDDSFTPSRSRGPGGAELPEPDLEHELITLAHEYGHLMSYRGETPRSEWDRYTAAASKRGEVYAAACEHLPEGLPRAETNERIRRALREGLTDDERARIVAEESLAWRIGRAVLIELGLTDLSSFDKREREGLHAHRYRLGMEDAWPEDDAEVTSE